MEREEAFRRLKQLEGQDLRPLADKFCVTVWKGDKLNKGWAGQVLERYLDLPINSAQAPNFGSWELKLVSLKRLKSGGVVPKETMQITMIDAYDVARKPFEHSHLLAKLRKALICATLFISRAETSRPFVKAAYFDLGDGEIYESIKADYEIVRNAIRTTGFESLTGKMGVYVQPRTKGAGHGSTSRAFYARTGLVERLLRGQSESN
jgi:DNA mismatch repair protein MutH